MVIFVFFSLTAAVLNLSLLVVMSLWQPSSDQVILFFVLVGCWGFGDGIWLSQASSEYTKRDIH